MASRIAVMAALLVLFACNGEAKEFTVGDTKHWTLGVNYSAWASHETFHMGDILVFIYAAKYHNVLEVNQWTYSSCVVSNPLKEYRGGRTNVSLSSVGTKYFICGVPNHCPNGMKVAVTVCPTNLAAP